jgi:hypothetical protein
MGPVIPLTGTLKDKEKDLTTSLELPAAIRPRRRDCHESSSEGRDSGRPSGRADNFAWPNGSQAQSAAVAPETPIADQPSQGRLWRPSQRLCRRSDKRFGLGANRHQATGAEEGQRRKTHAAEAGEKLDTAASYSADAAAG